MPYEGTPRSNNLSNARTRADGLGVNNSTTFDQVSSRVPVLKPTTTYRLVAQRVPYTKYCLRMVRICTSPTAGYTDGNCATGNCATGNCAAGLVLQEGEPHEVTRIVVPESPVSMPPEHEMQKVPAEADEKKPDTEAKPADANPASTPRLTNPRDRLTIAPIRRIVKTSRAATDTGWQATARYGAAHGTPIHRPVNGPGK